MEFPDWIKVEKNLLYSSEITSLQLTGQHANLMTLQF